MKTHSESYYVLEYRDKNYTQGIWIDEDSFTTEKSAQAAMRRKGYSDRYSYRVILRETITMTTILGRRNASICKS